MTSNNQRRRKPRRRSSFPPLPRPVGATLVVARSRRPPVIPAPHHPSFLRRACPVPRHGAGIHPPSPSPSRRGNPCGCPFPAPTRFHPHPSQGHPSFLRRECHPCPHGAGIHPPLPVPLPCRGNPCGCPFPGANPFSSLICGLRKATRHSCGEPAPCPDTGQESILPPRPPPVGATHVVARSRRQPVSIPICGLRKATRHSCGGRNPSPPRPLR